MIAKQKLKNFQSRKENLIKKLVEMGYQGVKERGFILKEKELPSWVIYRELIERVTTIHCGHTKIVLDPEKRAEVDTLLQECGFEKLDDIILGASDRFDEFTSGTPESYRVHLYGREGNVEVCRIDVSKLRGDYECLKIYDEPISLNEHPCVKIREKKELEDIEERSRGICVYIGETQRAIFHV